jgi:hypothetical protein
MAKARSFGRRSWRSDAHSLDLAGGERRLSSGEKPEG